MTRLHTRADKSKELMIHDGCQDLKQQTSGDAESGALRRHGWFLLAILIAAATVRLWRLGSLPPGMFRDEAEKALNGWFLLNGGVDASGRPWPVFIEVFGVTTSAIYQYATLPFLAIGGLNEWTARLPAAVVGVLTVLFTWMFCRRVWGWQTAAWAAGFLAISPWHVPLSRWAQQGIFLPLLFIMAAWGLAVFLQHDADNEISQTDHPKLPSPMPGRRHQAGLLLTAACVAIAMYAYDPARLFGPLVALAAAILWWRTWLRRWPAVLAALAVFALFVSPVAWLLVTHGHEAQARFRFLSIYREGMYAGEIITAFAKNYIAHFSPDFLLIRGDAELRHSGGVGMLNVIGFAFAIAGAGFSIWRRNRWGWFMIIWVLLSPVASSLTRVGIPHALRSQVALPAWQVLAAIGVMGVAGAFALPRRKLIHQLVFLATLLGSLPFFLSYFGSYTQRAAPHWQYGVKQSLQYLNGPATANSHVIFNYVTGAQYLVPFYLKMDRRQFRALGSRAGRYEFLPAPIIDSPLPGHQQPQPVTSGPIAWVTPPGLRGPAGSFPIPIHAPGEDEQAPPAMLIYMNNQLLEQVKEQANR